MRSFFGRVTACLATAAALIGLSATSPARAIGLLILEGSDAQTFHSLEPYSTNFLNGMASFSTGTGLPIAILGFNPSGVPTVGKFALGGVIPSLATMMSSYSGIYLNEPSNCCSESALAPADGTIIRAFLEAGRSVAIENYQGGSQFDVVIGISGALATTANAHVAGFGGGAPGLGSCFDGNIVAPGGAAFLGLPVGDPVPNIGCFGHQAYRAAFFDPLGLTTYIATNPGLDGFNVVISNGGGGLIEAIPEPISMVLFGTGLLGLGLARSRRG